MSKNFIDNFLAFLLRHIRFIVLCAFIGALISLLVCRFVISPKYRATATAAISISDEYVENATYTFVTTQAELADALINYFDEDYLFDEMVQSLPGGLSRTYTAGELKGMFTTTNEEGTFILETTASAKDPNDAALLCNHYMTYALNHTLNLIGIGYYEMVEAATPPSGRYYPNYLNGAVVGGLVGVLAFCAVAFVLMLINNRVMTRKDLLEYFPDIPVLSEVAEITNHG